MDMAVVALRLWNPYDNDKIQEGELPIWPVIDEDKAKDMMITEVYIFLRCVSFQVRLAS